MMPVRPLHGQWRRPDLRNHRKILVVDDQIAFCGSQNLVEASYGNPKYQKMGRKWVDLMARVTGDDRGGARRRLRQRLVHRVRRDARREARRGPRGRSLPRRSPTSPARWCPSGPGFPSENNLRLFTSLLASATRRISITSPYFIPDESLLYAITTAAQRGVDVELFVNEQSDQFMVGHAQASYYDALLAAGVKILMYPPPLILHGKHFSIDDTVAVIGTSNMDLRSFALNYEVCMMLLGPEAVAQLRKVEDTYRSLCRPLTQEEWSQRSQADPLRRHRDAADGGAPVAVPALHPRRVKPRAPSRADSHDVGAPTNRRTGCMRSPVAAWCPKHSGTSSPAGPSPAANGSPD